MQKIKVTFVKDGKWWVAYTYDITGAMAQGTTMDEAEKNLLEIIKDLKGYKDVFIADRLVNRSTD